MKRMLALAVLCMALLAGCSLQGSLPAADSPAAADPLTGLEVLWPGQRPAAVVIDNSPQTVRQWGVDQASVVLEALTEGRSGTSLCLVYPSVDSVPKVGPVAQGRDLYWQLLAGQKVVPVQRGAGLYARNFLDYYGLRPVDALEVGRNAFDCDGGWEGTTGWYTSGTALNGVLADLGISSVLVSPSDTASAADSTAAEETEPSVPALLPFGGTEGGVEDAQRVKIQFSPVSSTGFVYDTAAGVYRMQRADGSPQTDADTGSQAVFDNLLVLYSTPTLKDDGDTWDYDLSVGGGVYLNGGKMWSILWMQGKETTLALYDEEGRAMNVLPGRSYLAVVGSVTGQELTVKDSTGANLVVP